MAKLLKLRRGTTSQHSSFTGAEGEVTVDTDKDVLVVHDGSTAGGHAMAAQDMDNVPAGSILGTQLENSGVTAGQYGSSSAIPIVTVDAQGLVTAASTTAIDSTTIANGSSSVSVANNGAITSNANHDFSAGIDVTGNITATGNITTSGDATITGGDFKLSGNFPRFLFEDVAGSDIDAYVVNNSNVLAFGKTNNPTPGNDILVLKLDDQSAEFKSNLATNGHVFTGDNQYYYVGDSNDGRYYHDGSHTYLEETGTGELRLASHNGPGVRITKGGSETLANFTNDGACELYHDNSQKLNTNGSGINVTGNIAVSGTVDGVDVAARDSMFGALTSGNATLSNGVLATTQAQSDNSTKVATTAYVRTAISEAQAFPSGTKMLFQQTSAPTGWTKQTSGVDNKALRVVSGTAGSGGSNAFSNTLASRSITANAANATQGGNISVANTTAGGNVSIDSASTGGTVNSHTLTINEIPSHSHSIGLNQGRGTNTNYRNNAAGLAGVSYIGANTRNYTNAGSFSTNNSGGGGGHSHGFTGGSHNHNGTLSGTAHTHNATFTGSAHNHSISVTNLDMAVQYLDVIIAAKD